MLIRSFASSSRAHFASIGNSWLALATDWRLPGRRW